MNLKFVAMLLAGTLVAACQSTSQTPNWYLNPDITKPTELVAVGQAISLDKAKQKAMSALNQQLWTEVRSTGKSRNIANNINGKEHYQQVNDFTVNTKTSALVLNGVTFTKAQQVGDIFFVEAKIDKANINAQLIADISQYNALAQFEIDTLAQTDALVWWLRNADVSEREVNMASRQSILSALSGAEYATPVNVIVELKDKVARVHASIRVLISADKQAQWMKESITRYLTEYHIQVVDSNTDAFTHRLILDTDWRNTHLADMYISTVQVNLILKNNANLVVASNEIIANANSVTSFERASEGASRRFSTLLKQQDFWKALGL